ncbi:hypothetical protein, partial [Lentilactobacillus parakefiri]|uniref:hypothetical protein n=1 Tax=Lentilactobacillus parakefiri TaxID=152332 RepID=UPI001CDAE57E
ELGIILMAANMNKLAKMMANLTHIFGWIEKLSRIFQRKWKMRLSLFIGGTYVPASLICQRITISTTIRQVPV